jgi:alpha-L-rhamnosidase
MSLVANWIWSGDDPAARNVLMQFRRSFTLKAGLREARLHISADTRYLLHVNAVRIGYGPARNYHAHYEYDTYDLGPHLRLGENVIALAVSHWGEGTFHQMVGRAGLLVQVDVDGHPRLLSDEHWRARRSAAHRQSVPRIACQMAWEEQVDARLEDVGWTAAGFDERAWEPAVVVGPVGSAPWGALSPRSIPFLTDEPIVPVRAHALGRVHRPEVVAVIHAGPYLAPGDISSNRQTVDALITTTLHVPRAGEVMLKRCSVAGGDPPTGDTLRVLVDARLVHWQLAAADYGAVLNLEAGDHALLIDWNGKTHDMDITLTASGLDDLAMTSPLPGESGTWAIAVAPGAARASAALAVSPDALLRCGANWQPVAAADTPEADVYMDITASVPVEPDEQPTRLPIFAAPIPTGQAQHYLIDFGREAIGWIELDVEAPAGTTFDVLGFEAVQEGRRQMTSYMNNTLRYVCRAGRQSYVSTLRRGLRYVIVAVHSNTGEAVLHNVSLRLATYPWNIQGAFRCSDPRLNQIWDLCAYTLRLCSEDTFTDCPTYEQTLWTGDACHSDVLLHQTVHGDSRLTRRVLLLVATSLERLPIAGAQVPGDWENDVLPNWSWLWAMGCANYYRFTGDEQFAREVYPALAKQAGFIEAGRNAAGILELPGYWHLLDWADMPREPNDILAHESCLAVAALKATAALAQVAGHPTEAERWFRVAAELAAAINRECWRADRQAYADLWLAGSASDNFSQPTNIVALLAGVADGERADTIAPKLLTCPEGWVPLGTPWMHSIACGLLAERGQIEPVLNAIRDRWGDMLDKGATTAWETFSGFQVGWWTRSWCHAWSALPAYLMSAFVLGVRPLEPGYQRTLIAPQLGDLTWAEGKLPTPHGAIAVRAEKAESGLIVRVTLPEGAAAEVRIAANGDQAPVVTGSSAEIERVGSDFVVALPSGAKATIVADTRAAATNAVRPAWAT